MSIENNQNQNQQYNPQGEDKNLLNSENDVQIIKNESQHDLSRMDQSIDIGQSVEPHDNENGYQKLIGSETSLYNPEKNLKLKKEDKFPFFSKVKNACKNFFCKADCKMNEKNFNDKQLVMSIFFRGAAAYYFFKKTKVLNERRQKSISDEKVLRNIDSNLQKNGFLYYDNSTSGQKTLLKGQFISKHYPLNTPIEIKAYKPGSDNNSFLQSSETRKVQLTTDQYLPSAVPIPLQSQKSLFTSAVAGLTYLASSNICKLKIKTDSLSNFSDAFYFFGTKNNVTRIITAENVFSKIDWLKIKSDQKALKICAVLATGLTILFAYKTIKSTLILTKRKKGFFSKLVQELKEYFQL